MDNLKALAEQLLKDLAPNQRAELIERLLLPDRDKVSPLSPRDAGIVCSAGMSAVARSMKASITHTHADLDELGEALFYGLDSFWSALETAAHFAEGSRGHGPSGTWERASFDALNVRDHVAEAVRKSHEWGDDYPSYVQEF
ncbi:hypothetical protein [Streptomyces sp. LN500]|uniref:hypothetical protein n=1 Tax=Streptomyces sp. LN500 TaxID=3112978 RepID=UPI00371CA368